MEKYKPQRIEKKWQKFWIKSKVFEPNLKTAKNPFYNLMMFPYPSAEGLHIGNMYAFTGSDIYGKFKKIQGYDLFEPMGLDGFGIHSENFALKIGKHPMDLSKITEKNFYKQLHSIGNSFSWSDKIETYNPKYYKWTQWLFLQLYKNGLAYQKEAPVNWCPKCKTVLSDEQSIQGECERCSSKIQKKFLKQWFLKITKYSEKLLENLDKIDWSEKVKLAQKNWIGKSEGTLIKFPIYNSSSDFYKNLISPSRYSSNIATDNLQFTIEVFTTRIDTIFGVTFLAISPNHKLIKNGALEISNEAKKYVEDFNKNSDDDSEKTGIFSGLYAINPANQNKNPVWITNYVLETYGTGAVMGVPAHDQRDFEFAKKYNLAIKEVIFPRPPFKKEVNKAFEAPGIMINSGEFNGLRSEEALIKVLKFLQGKNIAEKFLTYHLRDWLISRQRYWGTPIPIIYCKNCGVVPVPEKDLPVKLPYVKNFKPLETDKSPLANESKFYKTRCPKCKREARRETDVCDTFLDSSWYYLGYLVVNQNLKLKTKNENLKWDKNVIKKWLPVNMYIGGAEHSVLHLMYSRFIAMALYDFGLIHFDEPFKKFRAHGLLIREGAKMSKSKGNIVTPDDYIKKYGADTIRMYLMFLGPFDQGGNFQDKSILGIYRFLNRVWQLVKNSKFEIKANTEIEKIMHQTIQKVSDDIENLKYNTAISQLMIYQNQLSINNGQFAIENIKVLLLLLAPFAPHICEQLWQFLQNKKSRSIFQEKWPKYDPEIIEEKKFTLIIQINGKVRDQIETNLNLQEPQIKKIALESEKIKKWIAGQQIKKTIYIKNKLINFVI